MKRKSAQVAALRPTVVIIQRDDVLSWLVNTQVALRSEVERRFQRFIDRPSSLIDNEYEASIQQQEVADIELFTEAIDYLLFGNGDFVQSFSFKQLNERLARYTKMAGEHLAANPDSKSALILFCRRVKFHQRLQQYFGNVEFADMQG